MALTVLLEVEYDAETEAEARQLAHRDAVMLFRQDDVLAVSADLKRPRDPEQQFPITAAYLDEKAGNVAERVNEYAPHRMDVDECIAEALRDDR